MPRSDDWSREGSAASPRSPSAAALSRVNLCYLWRHGRLPDYGNPRRFTEWVQHRKLYDRDIDLARLTDKLHAKAVASARIGDDAIIPTLWQGMDLPIRAPGPFSLVVKANHGCNQYRVVRDEADWQRARAEAARWIELTYGGWLDEWHYRAARRMILVEPFIGPGGELPRDYKIYVFGGAARCVQVHIDRAADHRWIQFDRGWNRLSHPVRATIARPETLDAMLASAEAIAGNLDFLRIDFYEVEGRLLFGETCLFPGSGLDPFDPVELDYLLGDHWARARGVAVTRPREPNRRASGTVFPTPLPELAPSPCWSAIKR